MSLSFAKKIMVYYLRRDQRSYVYDFNINHFLNLQCSVRRVYVTFVNLYFGNIIRTEKNSRVVDLSVGYDLVCICDKIFVMKDYELYRK
jgi:hypothetical protein